MSTSQIKTTLTVAYSTRPGQALKARAVFELTDPYAVRLELPNSPGMAPVAWVFARDLLRRGLKLRKVGVAVGMGDITISRADNDDYLAILLRPPGAVPLTVFARRDELTSFVNRTVRLVPAGREDEWIDWSAAHARLARDLRRAA